MKSADNRCLHLNTVRIYLHDSQKVPGATFWQRFWNSNLATCILKRAKESGLRQAILFPVKAGFLQDSKLVFGLTEIAPASLPVCIEIVDEPGTLRSFLTQNSILLRAAMIVTENSDTYKVATYGK